MYLLTKYLFIVLYVFGLIFIGAYINFCEINDFLTSYISKKIYKLPRSYDYIIVGSGSAGSVIANRLSEDPNVTVLLLEAGNYGGRLLDIPALAPVLHKTNYDWQYKTEPQQNACKAFNNNSSAWPMGKIFGGTGRLNNMMYTRGHQSDFEDWYKNVSDFNYKTDILEFFKKSENQVGSFINESMICGEVKYYKLGKCALCEADFHATKGPLAASDLSIVSEFSKAIISAAKYLGFPIRDINGKHNTGFSQPQANLKDGSRYTTAHYLLQHRKKNLAIMTASTVEKVLFKSNFEAHAVKFWHLGEEFVVKAQRGVILSAGVIGTPKILMHSGIGIKSHLDDIGIKTRINLPVGNNLQDHIGTGFDLITLKQPLSLNFFRMSSPLSAYEYFFKSRGPLTTIGCEALAILSSNCLNISKYDNYDACEHKLKQRPDLELIFMPVAVTADFGVYMKNIVGLKDQVWSEYFSKVIDKNAVNILAIVLHPKSRGTVRLTDGNPWSKPIIDPQYLTHPYDVEILLKGIGLISRLIETEPMQKLGAKINRNKFPGCESHDFGSRSYWECYARHLTLTLYHPIGTCKMGQENDEESVVNYDFRVIGSNKLFVGDASVLPSLVSANINAAVVMIAEKVAAMVKYYKHLDEGTCNKLEIFISKNYC